MSTLYANKNDIFMRNNYFSKQKALMRKVLFYSFTCLFKSDHGSQLDSLISSCSQSVVICSFG